MGESPPGKLKVKTGPPLSLYFGFIFILFFTGLSMGMSFLWESHGKRPKGWDGTAHICISHETQK